MDEEDFQVSGPDLSLGCGGASEWELPREWGPVDRKYLAGKRKGERTLRRGCPPSWWEPVGPR